MSPLLVCPLLLAGQASVLEVSRLVSKVSEFMLNRKTENPTVRARRGTNRVTMEDVAAHAGVSASSVSLFLRQPDAVSKRMAPAIKAAIKDLGYVPNRLAGSLAAANTRAVAVIIPSLTNAFFSNTVSAIQRVLEEKDYQLMLGISEYSAAQEAKLVKAFLSWSPAAVIVTGTQQSRTVSSMLRGAGVPVAQIWEIGGKPFDLQVGFQHEEAGATVTQHLHEVGCRKIAFIGARMERDRRAFMRATGYRKWLEAHAAQAPIVLNVEELASPQVGADIFRTLLDTDPDVDGICCANDVLALGLLFEAQRQGIAIPEQIAVTGFGDLPFSAISVPQITTVRLPSEQIGIETAQQILRRIEGRDARTQAQTIDLGFELVVRESTRKHQGRIKVLA